MHTFDFIGKYSKLLTNDIVALLAAIHEQKGKQTLAAAEIGDVLEQLIKISKIQSTEASNRIEGVVTTDERLK
ncbi:MAG: cell filamentation protein Fic, partial [Oscillospiraceae bacterium]|nr:cell filamentation protein Fic [Oscillospiraceae bacterium]